MKLSKAAKMDIYNISGLRDLNEAYTHNVLRLSQSSNNLLSRVVRLLLLRSLKENSFIFGVFKKLQCI